MDGRGLTLAPQHVKSVVKLVVARNGEAAFRQTVSIVHELFPGVNSTRVTQQFLPSIIEVCSREFADEISSLPGVFSDHDPALDRAYLSCLAEMTRRQLTTLASSERGLFGKMLDDLLLLYEEHHRDWRPVLRKWQRPLSYQDCRLFWLILHGVEIDEPCPPWAEKLLQMRQRRRELEDSVLAALEAGLMIAADNHRGRN